MAGIFLFFFIVERIIVSNATSFSYEYTGLSPLSKTAVFQVSAQSDLHIVLSTEGSGAGGDATVYSLVLGGEDNMYSWISKGISSNYYINGGKGGHLLIVWVSSFV